MSWIKLKEEPPPLYEYVFVLADLQGTDEPRPVSIARYENPGWGILNREDGYSSYGAYMDMEYLFNDDDITHWMPLPALPKRET